MGETLIGDSAKKYKDLLQRSINPWSKMKQKCTTRFRNACSNIITAFPDVIDLKKRTQCNQTLEKNE